MFSTFSKNCFLLLLFAIIAIHSCKKSDERQCFKNNGKQIELKRPLEPFHKVILRDNVNLTIIKDTVNELLLSVPENLANFIISEVKDGVLEISNTNKCNWLRSFKIKIDVVLRTSSLENLELRGAGYVNSIGSIENDYFEINLYEASSDVELILKCVETSVKLHNGPGNVNITGNSGSTNVYNAGNGFINMQNFESERVIVRHKGTGACHVLAKEYLNAVLEYVGDIHYYGNPLETEFEDNGKGSIIKH